MKASMAFAIGLWTGGLLVGSVWIFYHQQQSSRASVGTADVPVLNREAMNAELRRLDADNARLHAETERSRQAYQDLLNAGAASGPAVPPVSAHPETVTIPMLEELAQQNQQAAIEELLLTTDENYQALLRLARSTDISERNRTAIEIYLAGIVEQFLNEHQPTE